MNYTFEKAEKSTIKLTIELNEQDWANAINEAYLKDKAKYRVEGFRPGKAPKSMIEKLYGQGVFFDTAIELSFYKYYNEILDKETSINPIDRPELGIDAFDGKTLKMTATIPVMPEVKLGDYKGINIKKVEYNVEDADIENEVKSLLERGARLIDVTDRAVQNGDTVTIDYSGSVDGVKFAGGTAEKQPLVIGSGSFIPGFEEQIVGMNIGEDRDITVKFPEEYHAKELAGKDAVFAIKLHEIKVNELPELTDELVKDSTEFESVEDFKKGTREKLEKANAKRAESEIEDEIIKTISNNAEVEIPEALILSQVDTMVKNFEYRLMYQGLKLDKYLEYTKQTIDEFKEGYKADAEKNVKAQLVIQKIIEVENIKAEQADIDAKLEENAKEINKTVEEYKKLLKDGQEDYIARTIVVDKLMKFLKDNNNIA